MSILSQKKDVFEQISVLKTASELSLNDIQVKNDIFSAFNSSKVKNNKDPFLFIVDLLTILAGSSAVNKVINQCFSSLSRVEDNYKTNLKHELTSLNGGVNSNPQIPSNLLGGAQIHINKIDLSRELFTQQTSPAHDLYLDDFKKNLIGVMKAPGTFQQINPSITASYNSNTGFFTIKPVNPNQTFNSFLSGMVDNVKFIDQKILLNQTLDNLFNTQNKTKTQITTELQLDLMLNKLISQVEEDDSYFTFNTQELNDIEFKVNTSDQLYAEVGCGRVGIGMTLNDVQSATSAVTFPVSTKVIDTTLTNIANTIINQTNNPNLKQGDLQSLSNNFFSSFMQALKNMIIKNFLLSPQLNIIYALSQSFSANVDNVYDPITDIKNRKSLITCLIKKIINDLLSDIFNLVKKELLTIVGAVAAQYALEAIEKYKLIITSFSKSL